MIKDKMNKIITEGNNWDTVWEKLYEMYPNVRGYFDLTELYEKIIDNLPEIDERYIMVEEDDFSEIAEATATYLVMVLKIYNRMLGNKGVGMITS